MTYNPSLGLIPGYDTIVRFRNAQKMQKDWQKHVGSKGRRIAYDTARYDYGSYRQAMNSIYNDVQMFGNSLPFKR